MSIQNLNQKDKLFYKGIECFNKQNFYDAHEYWEDLWSDYRLKDAKLIQALIQLSVGYFHITNNNIKGANGLFNKSLPKFEMYFQNSRGLDVKYIILSINKTIKCMNSVDDLSQFDWTLVPKIKVTNGR